MLLTKLILFKLVFSKKENNQQFSSFSLNKITILLFIVQRFSFNFLKLIQKRVYNLNLQIMQGQAPDLQVAGQDITALNQQLLDRLRLLQYEKEYVTKGNKAINSASFTFATNPTEQFNNFKNLVKWLFQVNDVSSSQFSKYDDPMTVSTNIINQSKKLQIACDFPPLKLKTGCGQQVVSLLNQLATKALKRKNFNFKKPKYEDVKELDQQKPDDGDAKMEDGDQMIDEAEIAEDDEMDDRQQIGAAIDQDKQIIISAVSQNDWKLQCERVANKLKVQTKNDTKQWRAHMDTIKNSGQLVKKNFPNARVLLEKLNDQLGRTLDKISKSQKSINSNMSDIGDQYKNQSEELKKLSSHYNNLSNSIKQMNQNYRTVNEKLEQVLTKTNEHSGSMTDSSPVVKIKDAYKVILAQIKSMDVRMGVLSHTILQYKSKERNQDKKNRIQIDDLEDFE